MSTNGTGKLSGYPAFHNWLVTEQKLDMIAHVPERPLRDHTLLESSGWALYTTRDDRHKYVLVQIFPNGHGYEVHLTCKSMDVPSLREEVSKFLR